MNASSISRATPVPLPIGPPAVMLGPAPRAAPVRPLPSLRDEQKALAAPLSPAAAGGAFRGPGCALCGGDPRLTVRHLRVTGEVPISRLWITSAAPQREHHRLDRDQWLDVLLDGVPARQNRLQAAQRALRRPAAGRPRRGVGGVDVH